MMSTEKNSIESEMIASEYLVAGKDFDTPPFPENKTKNPDERVIIYARIPNSEVESHLNAQIYILKYYCKVLFGFSVSEVVKELDADIGDSLLRLSRVLQEKKPARIMVMHSDWLTRRGYSFFDFLNILPRGCELVVVDITTQESSVGVIIRKLYRKIKR